ncbi:hypothetical protein SAMN05421863_101650 [Nitrosomonas communis]|uniref:Uncharacterized protein n=2 Tax=Nitrosomonas communis TaxID=44574 RepID=A0A1I4NTM1_9PROT|nr:hypothetical protein SAMN05421863_101650 [Nitrosomonas communis]
MQHLGTRRQIDTVELVHHYRLLELIGYIPKAELKKHIAAQQKVLGITTWPKLLGFRKTQHGSY